LLSFVTGAEDRMAGIPLRGTPIPCAITSLLVHPPLGGIPDNLEHAAILHRFDLGFGRSCPHALLRILCDDAPDHPRTRAPEPE
jgi:hypothetical protein